MDTFEIIAAVVIAILSVARTARLIVFDEYPPMAKMRDAHDRHFGEEGWGKLIHCPFCCAPYLAVGMAVWWWLGGDHWTWWWINGVWGGSYVASIIVAYDQPE